jgi:alpha-galactosidase
VRCCVLVSAAVFVPAARAGTPEPVHVFILAGQSNMQGHGRVEVGKDGVTGAIGSLRYLVNNDPPNYGHLTNPDGTWATRPDVWINYNTGSIASPITVRGDLTAGYGNVGDISATGSSLRMGPELAFGQVMGDYFTGQVLLIKEAWGGKSLAVDFRPPSSGGTVGPYYNKLLNDVNDVLSNIGTYFPGYAGQGYVLEGIAWHQGWNDRVNQGYNDQYETNLVNFIKDIRQDLGQPNLPFVVANTGMSGWGETHHRALSLMLHQQNAVDPNRHPEFAGTTGFVETRDFWRDASVSPVNQAYHWNQNAEILWDIGEGLGEQMVPLIPEPTTCLLLLAGAARLLRRRRRR